MVTTKRIKINARSSAKATNVNNKPNASWAESVEAFYSNTEEENHFEVNGNAKFFVIKRKEGDFNKTSPFLIQKAIQSVIGEPKTIKKLRTGELLIELENSKQASNLKTCTSIANIPVLISPHRSLNSSRGVISEPDLQYVSDSEILENLKNQNVTSVRRISINRDGNQMPTKHLILTFNSPTLPHSIKAGYLKCSIRPYIPNPLRCFQCQRFGHTKISCRGKVTCARCGIVGHENETCTSTMSCVNCKKDHPAYSKSCEKWKFEKEIAIVRVKQNLTYFEARKTVEARTPTVGVSYAAIATKSIEKKSYCTTGTQTDLNTKKNTQGLGKTPTTPNKQQSVASSIQSTSAKQSTNTRVLETKTFPTSNKECPLASATQGTSTKQSVMLQTQSQRSAKKMKSQSTNQSTSSIQSCSTKQSVPSQTQSQKSSKETKAQPRKESTSLIATNRSTISKNGNSSALKTKLTRNDFFKNQKAQPPPESPPVTQNKCNESKETILHINTDSELSDTDGDNMSTTSEKSNDVDEYI